MNALHSRLLSAVAAFAATVIAVSAQAPVPAPALVESDRPVVLAATDPLRSLEEQIEMSGFDRRGSLASAFDEANEWVGVKLTALRASGADLVDEAEDNLDSARNSARDAFRGMSLTTVETWNSAQHNAVMALRRIRASLEDLERTATLPQ